MGAYGVGAKQTPVDVPITAPATEDAKRWEGWGTALKPGHEAWILARKPLIGSVAANVLAHGTGALNIDGCRIDHEGDIEAHATPSKSGLGKNGIYGKSSREQGANSETRYHSTGRWPANVILSEQAAAELDEQTGTLTSGAMHGEYEGNSGSAVCYSPRGLAPRSIEANEGGASRFYYVPKPSTAERNAGLAGMPERANRINAPRENEAANFAASRGNHHPTVKSIALMAYLCRLITPPGGTVLDCFAGSGTTGMAALVEGFSFVGIEREPEYAEIARRRIAWQAAQGRQGSLL